MLRLFLIASLLALSSASSLEQQYPDVVLNRSPYVMNITKNEVTVLWKTILPSIDSIRYGKLTDREKQIFEVRPRTFHQHRLEDLDPDTCYIYSVLHWGEAWQDGKFCTAPEINSTPLHFSLIGDSGMGTPEQYRISEMMKIFYPTFILHVGDVVYPNGAAEKYDKFFFLPYKEILKNIPFYLTLGNHDITTKNGKPYFDAFDLPINNKTSTEQFYSFEWGNILFIALDSNSIIKSERIGKLQLEWLEEILKESTHRWRFIFLHHPVYASKGKHGSTPELQERLLPIIKRYNIHAVFSGHDHHYERTKVLNGTVYIVSGGGGANVRPVKPNRAFSEVALATHHFVDINITDDQFILTAINQFGDIIDHVIYSRDDF